MTYTPSMRIRHLVHSALTAMIAIGSSAQAQDSPRFVSITGKVVTSEGVAPLQPVAIELVCWGGLRATAQSRLVFEIPPILEEIQKRSEEELLHQLCPRVFVKRSLPCNRKAK